MRKIITIPFILLILFSGITVNLAFHYCGGMLADRSISLSGSPASCGMEGETSHQHSGMKSLCCENSVSSYTFSNIYLPSSTVKDDAADHQIPVPEILSSIMPANTAASFSSEVMVRPPGTYSPTEVELDSICIFRI